MCWSLPVLAVCLTAPMTMVSSRCRCRSNRRMGGSTFRVLRMLGFLTGSGSVLARLVFLRTLSVLFRWRPSLLEQPVLVIFNPLPPSVRAFGLSAEFPKSFILSCLLRRTSLGTSSPTACGSKELGCVLRIALPFVAAHWLLFSLGFACHHIIHLTNKFVRLVPASHGSEGKEIEMSTRDVGKGRNELGGQKV